MDKPDHLNTLVNLGGAILPGQIDLDSMMARKILMGRDGPKVRIAVGKNYGQNSDGSPKPIRAIIEEWV